jgi:uncharacterized repeat protein (TIGR03803 family)
MRSPSAIVQRDMNVSAWGNAYLAEATVKMLRLSIVVSTAALFSNTAALSQSGGVQEVFSAADGSGYIVQAPDSNYYAASYTLDGIVRITQAGSVSGFYTFTGGADGEAPSAITVGPDGKLYGTTVEGGTNGFGTIFAIDLTGHFTTLYSFPAAACGGGLSYSGWLLPASDGNLYGPYQNTIFKISTAGTYSSFFTFPNTTSSASCVPALMQASDGNFYGPIPASGESSDYVPGYIYRLTLDADYSVFYTAPDFGPTTALIEGHDGRLYGDPGPYALTLEATSTPVGTLDLYAPLTLASDGNFYATGADSNFGGLYQISPSGSGNELFSFSTYDDDTLGEADTYPAIQGSNGNLYLSSRDGTPNGAPGNFFEYAPPNAPLPAPVQVSVSPQHVGVGQNSTLKWNVPGAAAVNYPICFAAGTGGWSGLTTTSGSITSSISTAGTYTFALTCGGNESGVATLTVSKNLGSTVSVSASPNPVPEGTSVTLTATVTPSGAGPLPTGTVSLYYGSTLLATETLSSGSASYSASTAGIPPGTYPIAVKYSGDTNYALESSSPYTLTVANGQAPTTIAITASPNPAPDGKSMTLTATIKGTYGAAPTGMVTFHVGSSTKQATVTNGIATATITETPGIYSAYAVYAGTVNDAPSTSSAINVIFQDTTTTMLTVTPTTVVQGNQVSLKASVSSSISNNLPGNVTFMSGSIVIGTASLTYNSNMEQSTATLGASSAGVPDGTYAVTAKYDGSSQYAASVSATVNVTVESSEASRKK